MADKKTHTVALRMDDALFQWLGQYCEKERRSKNNAMVFAIDRFLRQEYPEGEKTLTSDHS